MSPPTRCRAFRDVAAELALGILDGPERGEALAHMGACEACQAYLQALTQTVDHLVTLAPEAEPPAGFESAVIARIAEARGSAVTPRRAPSRLVLAAAAVVLLVVGLVAGVLLAGRGGDGAGELASAAMVAPDGDTVGEVWRYGEDGATLFVSVPAWADVEGVDGPRYAFRLALEGGETVEVGDFGLGDGSSSWGITTDVDAGSIEAVSVIDDTGRVWCTGHFT